MKLLTLFKASVLAGGLAIAGCATTQTAPDIVEVAQSAGSFDTLVAAVTAADLADTLKSEGPFTVFAPTDEAFAALPEGTVETLLKPENKDQLTAILTYHVLPGKVMAADVAGQRLSPATVNGKTVHVDGRNGVKVNDATVTAADIAASNGVIHVIDKVLLP
ncbi:fasciclin domain-containing protein [Roseobacter sinensis]|uniref:Fasciclin domain-containing protein n=1 Tax=Roseobacter sinensis TaxID=2931391 RepID=A0ABT3BKD0_9RHOB|nr:fasciclin domain-containing protein [Roseobacter sp. WL0113]MCV3274021.1 fasciclin domain-containing protein [Roseobacter sp. WL0113]